MTHVHYTVQCHDRRNPTLSGRGDLDYESPPHTLQHAQELAEVLLDQPTGQLDGEGPWQRAIAGGRRTVTLHVADQLFDPDTR